jgi:hypothetical protein
VPEESTPGGSRAGDDADDGPVLRSTRLPAASASAVAPGGDDQAADAGELREALSALRATLEGRPPAPSTRAPVTSAPAGSADVADAEAPPPPSSAADVDAASASPAQPARRTIPRPALVAGAVVVLAALVALALRGGPGADRAAPVPSASASSSASAASSTSGSAQPSPSGAGSATATPPPSPHLATHPLPWPGGAVLQPPGLATGGPGANVPGLELTAALDPDGRHVDVYERLLLRPGITSLVLSQADPGVPALRLAAGVRDLQVELDGRPVQPRTTGASWQVASPDGGPVTRAVLRYRLSDVFVRRAPAPPGRYTLVLRPLGAPAVLAARDPVVVRIDDARVGTVTCPTSRQPLCGSVAGRLHTATLPADATAVVLAQVDRG